MHKIEQELRLRLEDSLTKNRALEAMNLKKDEDIYKLRQDNSSLFNDLKSIA